MSVDATAVDVLVFLERASVDGAKQFAVVCVDRFTGDVMHTTGPFAQAEQALVQAGIDEAEWRANAENPVEAASLRWLVVPQWEPST